MINDKEFDCVAMMHASQEANRKEREGMSIQEELAYWEKIHQDALAKQRNIQAQQQTPTP
jgi:hypothetical protein